MLKDLLVLFTVETALDYSNRVNLSVKVLDLSVWWPQPSQYKNR